MTALRSWCCGTPLDGPHVAGCSFEPNPDDDIDWAGLFKNGPGAIQVIPESECTYADPLAAINQFAAMFDPGNFFGLADIMLTAIGDALFTVLPIALGAIAGAADELEFYGDPS